MLKDYFENKRVIVVGPSPHLVGKNYGEFIDSFDLVVRINELGVISGMAKDYGSRTDICFLTLTKDAVKIYSIMKEEVNLDSLKLVIHPRDEHNLNPLTMSGKTKNVKDYYKNLDIKVNFQHLEDPTFEKRCEIFGCFPSTGSLAIYEILKYNFSELFICGFSFYTTKYIYSPKGMEYYRIPKQNQHKHNFRWSGHDTEQEVKVLRKLIKKHNNIEGDYFFRKIILSKTVLYYKVRKFIVYKLNLDNYKNIIKIFFRINR
tara:strand:- start:486 stop:1265 length:780 start_codon:yes stop_codon:yes gene_type:complete